MVKRHQEATEWEPLAQSARNEILSPETVAKIIRFNQEQSIDLDCLRYLYSPYLPGATSEQDMQRDIQLGVHEEL
jgi:hypothetical protein